MTKVKTTKIINENKLNTRDSQVDIMNAIYDCDPFKILKLGKFMSVNFSVLGGTPLHIAISINAPKAMIGCLVHVGASLDAKDCEGATPLEYALELGKHDIAQFLELEQANQEVSV